MIPAREMAGRQHQRAVSAVANVFPGRFRAPETAVGQFDRPAVLGTDFQGGHELAVGELHTRMRLRAVHLHGHGADVTARLRDDCVARPVPEVVEVKPDQREDDKAVADELPVRFADLEADEILLEVSLDVATGKRRRAFLYSLLSGVAEPAGALLGYLALRPFLGPGLVGTLFGGVAGIMVYISLDELLPTSRAYGRGHDSMYGLLAGMGVMALSLLLMT